MAVIVIVHVLKSSGGRVDAPEIYGAQDPLPSVCPLGRPGGWNDLFHSLATADGSPAKGSDRQFYYQSASLRVGRQRGIARSRGGRTTKIRALTDAQCRACAFLRTGGPVAD